MAIGLLKATAVTGSGTFVVNSIFSHEILELTISLIVSM
jgi:hypothetical protein